MSERDEVVERAGWSLPGWLAVAVTALALAGAGYGCGLLGWIPDTVTDFLAPPAAPVRGDAVRAGWGAFVVACAVLVVLAVGGLTRCRAGSALGLSLYGRYRGTVRRTGLRWVSPFVLRRRIDVRLRHWRGEPLAAVDADGLALRVEALVVWRVRDTARALYAVRDHEAYLRGQIEVALARVFSRLPPDAFHESAPTLRDPEAVGAELAQLLTEECAATGVEVLAVRPTRIEYAPEVAAVMSRRRLATLDARQRAGALRGVVDSVEDTLERLTGRGLVELDEYERNALVRDLTVAFARGDAAGT
ncbi:MULTISPECIES: SPFH domain-containing protein [unclassified Streptomyces]|uniref:SPFH domain-containing protein n=1 Tax=unclassified Streptomyces TaxID=2593676 RepID=UPI00278C08DD|nr:MULTISPECIES: SPFH domain-containing protein [unclassified Streptomyces]